MTNKLKEKRKKIITKIIFIFLILFISIIYSQDVFSSNVNYYANLNITLFNDGSISIINPDTNDNEFKNIYHSQKFTSKNKQYWILNITSNKIFENFIFKLTLPKNIVINYIKTTPHLRFENQNSQLKLIGIGENKPIQIIIQYKIDSSEKVIQKIDNKFSFFTPINLIIFSSFMLFVLIIISFLIFIILKKKIKKRKDKSNGERDFNNKNSLSLYNETKIDTSKLPIRQQEIIKILKKKGKISQKELENLMEIPKSSISRNLRTLEIKGIIKKERLGITNYLYLK